MFFTAVKAKAVGLEGDGRPICRCEKDKELAADVGYSLRADGLEADDECLYPSRVNLGLQSSEETCRHVLLGLLFCLGLI